MVLDIKFMVANYFLCYMVRILLLVARHEKVEHNAGLVNLTGEV